MVGGKLVILFSDKSKVLRFCVSLPTSGGIYIIESKNCIQYNHIDILINVKFNTEE